MSYFSNFQSNMPWLESRTIFMTKHGSQAYGTNLPTSDLDIKGVAVPPREYFLGFSMKFEQAEARTPNDLVIYDLRKFMHLAADCNPNICEVLWTDESDWLKVEPVARLMLDNKEMFISKKAKFTFSGYAIAQLKRINTHYRWLKNPPASPPVRTEYGLPETTVIPKDQLAAAEAAIKKRVEAWELDPEVLDPAARVALQGRVTTMLSEIAAVAKIKEEDLQWRTAAELVGYNQNFIDLLERERRYRSKKQEWDQYQNWKETRNAARSELEAKWGYDTKHAMHLVRLMRMCREILLTGKVVVKRPDYEELLSIRAGSWPYEKLIEWANNEDKAMNELYKTSTLRREPDRARLDALCVSIVEKMI